MKLRTFTFLFLLRILNKKFYIKLRSFIQLGYIYPKEGSFSSFLLNILMDEKRKDRLLRIEVADRLKVRKYVGSNDQSLELPKLLWKGVILTSSEYKNLPNIFYLKHISSSGKVKKIDKSINTLKNINNWIKKSNVINYGWLTREWYYSKKNFYICEEPIFNQDLIDYKFFCKKGEPFLLQVDIDRNKVHQRNIYSISNQGKKFELLNCKLHFYNVKKDFALHNLIHKAYYSAKKLSKEFDFIRVDLYIFDNKVYFGELTNIPGSGFERFYPEKYDKIVFNKMKKIKIIK